MFTCEKCGGLTLTLKYLKERSGWCTTCFYGAETPTGIAPMIATDSIPGGYWVRNGVCNPDGSPRRFDSKSEIERAAYNSGYIVGDNTPKPNPRLVEANAREREAKYARKG